MQRSTTARACHQVVIGLRQPAFQRAEGTANNRSVPSIDRYGAYSRSGDRLDDQPDGQPGFTLRALLALIFDLRLQSHAHTQNAIRLIGGHVGGLAVHHQPIMAKRGLVAAGGERKADSGSKARQSRRAAKWDGRAYRPVF